eukprot:GHVR01058469.1.p1 GENE.GHVR01058469.1~~GHVR01058469.1.p1  ORF type:complete len:102 (-),score=25.02 GHVR01058469.1:114-419(-)
MGTQRKADERLDAARSALRNTHTDAQIRDMEHELNLAARRGFVYDVKALVEKGLDVNFKSGANETPLHIASRSGHIDVVKFLIGRGAYVDPLNVHDRACVV